MGVQVVVQAVMLDAVNGVLRFNGDLLESDPNQDCATDMVPDNSGFATLISSWSGQLLWHNGEDTRKADAFSTGLVLRVSGVNQRCQQELQALAFPANCTILEM